MHIISLLLSRLSLVQVVALFLVLLMLSFAYGTRPLTAIASGGAGLQSGGPTVGALEFANLTDAVDDLKSAGFVKRLEARDENTFASSAIRPDDTRATTSDTVNLPRVIAIVKTRGEFEAYLREGDSLQIVRVGDTAGVWQVDEISLGRLRLSRDDVQEVIDIFGANAPIESQE